MQKINIRIFYLFLIIFYSVLGGILMSDEPLVEKVADNLVFPEGPVWHPDGYLIFSDIHNYTIEELKHEGGTKTWFSKGIKTNGMIMSNDNKKIYACCYSELCMIEIDAKTKEYKIIASEFHGRKFNNVNDVAIDAKGNIYFTDPKWGAKDDDIQGVYSISKEGEIKFAAKIDNQPNGIVVSPDQNWIFVARSGADDIWRFRLNNNGTFSDGKQWVQLEKNAEPDGMTIDSKGNLYVAQAGNGKLCIISPEGKIIKLIKIFYKLATNCEFKAGDESILYVTCAGNKDLKEGAIYKISFSKK